MIRFAKGYGGVLGIVLALTAVSTTIPAQAQGSYQPATQDPYLVIQSPGTTTYSSNDFPAIAPLRTTPSGSRQAAASTGDARPQYSVAAPSRPLLATQSGIQLGLQGSYYDYKEPGYGVELEGAKFGINPIGTLAFGETLFLTADLRYALGDSDYHGSGSNPDNFEDLFDLRALAGHDFLFNTVSVSPFIGFGYRRLYSDERGVTSDGSGGYRRTNQLYYLPLGITPRLRLDDHSRLAATLEGDIVLHGNQESDLSDVDPSLPDLNNKQESGYGLRGDLNYENGNWALGPFATYWHLDDSQTSCAQSSSVLICGLEPKNHTLEAGFQIRYRLL